MHIPLFPKWWETALSIERFVFRFIVTSAAILVLAGIGTVAVAAFPPDSLILRIGEEAVIETIARYGFWVLVGSVGPFCGIEVFLRWWSDGMDREADGPQTPRYL